MDFSYWPFSLIAILAAVAANATGAGGGVVFVPAFTLFKLDPTSVIATSFAIQCFGMTAGTLSWRRHSRRRDTAEHWSAYGSYPDWCLRFTLPAIVGVLLSQYATPFQILNHTELVFKGVSILFGLTILVLAGRSLQQKADTASPCTRQIQLAKQIALPAGLVGGFITGLISIGIGEVIAVLLIILRFPVTMAIGIAVTASACCVLVGVQHYLWFTPSVNMNVLFFAAPAAAFGGTIAKYLANSLPVSYLKLLIGAWILLSALAM